MVDEDSAAAGPWWRSACRVGKTALDTCALVAPVRASCDGDSKVHATDECGIHASRAAPNAPRARRGFLLARSAALMDSNSPACGKFWNFRESTLRASNSECRV